MNSTKIDAAAISLSGLCLAHCLALPFLASVIPFLGAAAEMEWLHKTFVFLAALFVAFALATAPKHSSRMTFVVLAIIGIGLLFTGAFIEQFHDHETLLTTIGAVVLASAHLVRWRAQQCCNELVCQSRSSA